MVPSNPFGLAGIPEFALWANRSTSFNVSQCQRLVSGPYALTEVVNVITFLTLLRGGNQQQIQALWGLSMADAATLSGYFNYLSTTFVQNTLNKVFNTGNATNPYLGSGGLFTTRYTPLVSCIIESLAYSPFLLQQNSDPMAMGCRGSPIEVAGTQPCGVSASQSDLRRPGPRTSEQQPHMDWQGRSR